jgi:hypothetical protein
MSARSALSRLNRNRKAAVRPILPNAWPLDHVEMAPGDVRKVQTVTIPPGNRTQIVCDNFPECACQSDCADVDPTPLPLWQFLIIAAIPVAVIGGCVAWRILHG